MIYSSALNANAPAWVKAVFPVVVDAWLMSIFAPRRVLPIPEVILFTEVIFLWATAESKKVFVPSTMLTEGAALIGQKNGKNTDEPAAEFT
jgi:hypothetical protein